MSDQDSFLDHIPRNLPRAKSFFNAKLDGMDLSDSPRQEEQLTITSESPHHQNCVSLVSKLLAELSVKYPDEVGVASLSQEDLTVTGAIFLLARLGDRPVGCGAIRPLTPGVAEVRRMFVEPSARGGGVGRKILEALEEAARNMGYRSIQLETGIRQPEAIGLYESAGYERMLCYGHYRDNPLSLCYEKLLK